MKRRERTGDLPPFLRSALDQWKAHKRAMNSFIQKGGGVKEDIPDLPPIVWECSDLDELTQKVMEDQGAPQVVFDEKTQKPFVVAFCFGRRQTAESIMNPEVATEFEWRTIVYYVEITMEEWKTWRATWSKDKQDWMEAEQQKRNAQSTFHAERVAERDAWLKAGKPTTNRFKKEYTDA